MPNIRKIKLKDFNLLKNNNAKIKFLLQFAILAPSTHNSQPWLFKVNNDSVDLLYNSEKRLPHTDKQDRGLYISLGACLENLIIAAKYFSVYKVVKVIMKDNHVATVVFDFDKKKNTVNNKFKELMTAITIRSNKRGIYNSKKLSTAHAKKISSFAKDYPLTTVHTVTDVEKKMGIANLSGKGVANASTDSEFRKEISSWINNNLSKKKEGMPGYAFRLPLLLSFIFPFLMKNFNLGKKSAQLTEKNIITAQLMCVITGKNNKHSWLEVGRVAERIMLEAHSVGISTTINVAAIEIENLYTDLMKLLNIQERPQFLFSLGYMDGPHQFTPRFNVEDKIIA